MFLLPCLKWLTRKPVFTERASIASVRAAYDRRAECPFHETGLDSAYFRKTFCYLAHGTVVNAQCRCADIHSLGHVPLGREQLGQKRQPLVHWQGFKYRRGLIGQTHPLRLKHRFNTGDPHLASQGLQRSCENFRIAAREQCLALRGERICENRGTNSPYLAAVTHQSILFEHLEVSAKCIGGEAELLTKLVSRKGLCLLERHEQVQTNSSVTAQVSCNTRHPGEYTDENGYTSTKPFTNYHSLHCEEQESGLFAGQQFKIGHVAANNLFRLGVNSARVDPPSFPSSRICRAGPGRFPPLAEDACTVSITVILALTVLAAGLYALARAQRISKQSIERDGLSRLRDAARGRYPEILLSTVYGYLAERHGMGEAHYWVGLSDSLEQVHGLADLDLEDAVLVIADRAGARLPRASDLDEVKERVSTVEDMLRYLEPYFRPEVVQG